MNVYLSIITTVLVLTQIIRLVQNAIQLKRLEEKANKEIEIMVSWNRMSDNIERLCEVFEREGVWNTK